MNSGDSLSPHDLAAERGAIGSMLCNSECIPGVLAILSDPEMCWNERNGAILRVIADMHRSGAPVDPVTLHAELKHRGLLQQIGGVEYLLQLGREVPTSAHAEYYAALVAEAAAKRGVVSTANRMAAAAANGQTAAEVVAQARKELDRIGAAVETEGAADGSEPAPTLVCMADVEPREISWLWPGRIPLGRISLLVGRPGEGKSFLTSDMAARISTGTPWPDGTVCPRGPVVMISAEDDAGDTIRPRLDASQADVRKVFLLTGVEWRDGNKKREVVFTLQNIAALEAVFKSVQPLLCVIDPIGSVLGGKTDAHRDNEVRGVLAPVAQLAERYGVAVLIVAHRRKSAGANADEGTLGSRAFTGIARAVWHLSRDPENKERRLLLPGKNNLAKEGHGLAFTIEGNPACLWWEPDPVTMNADEGLAAESGGEESHRPGPEPKAREAAEGWLQALLAKGPMPVGDPKSPDEGTIRAEAEDAGISWRTVRRAAEQMGVQSDKCPFAKRYHWQLVQPGQPASNTDNVDNLDNHTKTPGKRMNGSAFPREVAKLFTVGGDDERAGGVE